MPLAAGTHLGLYEIHAPLGAGGMGEIYRGTDTRLRRDVAVKVLRPELADDAEHLARFQREARALAALNHPHIVTIFSVEEAAGVHFFTTELVEGQSLNHHIAKEGLPTGTIVEIARALSEALAAAHEKGIVHRDLKPANVMVTSDGRVKVLDFGLAKDLAPLQPDETTLTWAAQTQLGAVMGTPAYMSPEQIAGRAVDQRTDIFSLGVVLFEMATGRRPFAGASQPELASAILRDTPLVTEVRSDLPAGLAHLIRRCLEKDPGHRVQTARDIANELRDLAAPASPPPVPDAARARPAVVDQEEQGFWVAVLPFSYAGSDADIRALVEGLAEEIVTGLSRFSYLKVISRSLTSRYGAETDVRSAGRELGARYVMEGSLRRAGTKLRIAAQLVDAASGADLWAEIYDYSFQPDAVFEILDDVVPKIVCTVADPQGILPHSMTELLRNRDPEQMSPYEAVLRSFAHFQRINAVEHAGARAALEQAVQNPPDRGDCWAMLSMLYREEYTHGFNLRPDPIGRSFAAARRAVEAAPSNHLAYHALASALFFRRETEAFRVAAERAVALNPMDGFTATYLGFLIAYSGNWERGCWLAEKARRLNPHHPGWYWFPAFFDAYRKRDYRGAVAVALKSNMPGFWRTNLALAAAYGQLGETEAGCNAVRELLAIRPDFAAVAREELGKWWDAELIEHLVDGLHKSGLDVASGV